MSEIITFELAGVVVLGVGAQWLATRLKIPAILLLLLAGFLVGPGPELVGLPRPFDPGKLFGELLLPVVSLAVAIILFEGGLTLDLAELPHAGRVIFRLVTLGAAATWAVGAVAARLILGLDWPLSLLLGAILTVTGPTVIGPLLRHVRPAGVSGPILRWEGIVIDPIGAMLAVLVFEAIPTAGPEQGARVFLLGSLKTVLAGTLVGGLGALGLALALRRHWVPAFLQSPVILMGVLAAFVASNWLSHESGLFAVTAMGLILANQREAVVRHIVEFKETLAVLLVSGLFVVLSARLSAAQVAAVGPPSLLFALALIVVARPLAVVLSTLGSGLDWRDRAFLMLMAPRGIVAASVASVFALRLREEGYAGADRLIPATFAVIVTTVVFYGLVAPRAARRMGLSRVDPGFLIAGANPLARTVAQALRAEGVPVLLVDTDPAALRGPRLAGLPVLHASILSPYLGRRVEQSDLGRLLALTPNEELNALTALHYGRHFGREQVYQLAPEPDAIGPGEDSDGRLLGELGLPLRALASRTSAGEDAHRLEKIARDLRGRVLFGPGVTYEQLAERLEAGASVKKTALTDEFTFDDYRALYDGSSLPMFLVDASGRVVPFTVDNPTKPRAGQAILGLVDPQPVPVDGPPGRAAAPA